MMGLGNRVLALRGSMAALSVALVLSAVVLQTSTVSAQQAPAWRMVDTGGAPPYTAWYQWASIRRVLLTDLDCLSATTGRMVTLKPQLYVVVEPTVFDNNGNAFTPLGIGFGGWCYVSADLTQLLDDQATAAANGQ
jgi:hypothetical protein